MRRAYTEDKKIFLKSIDININEGDGPNARSLFERLKISVGKRGNATGAEFDGVKILVRKGKIFEFSRDKRYASKIEELREVARKAESEHKDTAVALVEEKLDVDVNEDLARNVLESSIERLEDEISEREEGIVTKLTGNELREFIEILAAKDAGSDEFLKIEEKHWKDLSKIESNK